MKTQYCIICNKAIGLLGWPKHVNMHKKELGKDIYVRCKMIDENIRKSYSIGWLGKTSAQKRIDEFIIDKLKRSETPHKLADAERRLVPL